MPQAPLPVTYDPSRLILTINGLPYVYVNSCEAAPIDDEEFTTEKASTGQRAWIRTPEWGAELTIEFSGGLPAPRRQQLRMLKNAFITATAIDASGTADGVYLEQARIVQMPDFSRDDSEPTMELVIQSPHAQWGMA